MDKIRVAIIGSGGIATGAHAPAYAANSDLCELVACADVSQEAADKLATRYNCASYTDVARMLDEVQALLDRAEGWIPLSQRTELVPIGVDATATMGDDLEWTDFDDDEDDTDGR